MNISHSYHPRLHALLNIPNQQICRRQISQYLNAYINKHRLDINECSFRYIKVDPVLAELLDVPYKEIMLSKGHRTVTDWWDLVGSIDRKWRAENR